MKTLVRAINTVDYSKSDRENGYFIINDVYGTCFFRISNTRTHITTEVYQREHAICSYSKIPVFLASRCYHVYVETNNPFVLNLPEGARLFNFHTPSQKGSTYYYSMLVYCPSGEIPTIDLHEEDKFPEGIYLKMKDFPIIDYTFEMLCPLPVRHYYIDENGYVTGGQKPIIEPKFTGFKIDLDTKHLPANDRILVEDDN